MNKTVLLFTITIALFLSGCKTAKTVSSGSGELERKSNNEIVEDALNNEINYNTIYAKGSIEFKIGSSGQKAPAVFKLIENKSLQASVRIPLLGSEAMRLTITPDSIILIDRLKRKYVAENFSNSKVMADFDFNFYNLQSLFTNKLFIPGKKNVQNDDLPKFHISSTPQSYLLQTKGKGDVLYNFSINASNHISSTQIANEKKKATLLWIYSNFIEDNKQIYPTSMLAKMDISKKELEIEISYNKLEIDTEFSIDNSIPAKYTKVSFTDLIGSYINIK